MISPLSSNGNYWRQRPVRASGNSSEGVELGSATRLLVHTADLKKDQQDYRPVAFKSGPRGEIYVAYQSRQATYLSRVEADGSIAWESPTPFASISSLTVSPDGGSLLLKNHDGLVCFGSDGQVRSQLAFPKKVYSESCQDSTGRVYLVAEGKLEAYDATGKPVAQASPERAQPPVATPEGGVMLRAGNELVRIAPGGQESGRLKLEARPAEGKASYYHGRYWPLEGGEVLVEEVTNIEIRGPHAFRFRGGMGFGPGMDPDHFAPQYVSRSCLQRLASDGSKLWESESLGESPNVHVTPKGTVFWNMGGGKILRLNAEGREVLEFGPKASVQGRLVRHDGAVTRLGDPPRRIDLPANDYELRGETPDGRLLFEDRERRELYGYDAERGFVRLTDRHLEYTARLPASEPLPAGQVETRDGYVVVNGVRVPVRD